MRIAKMSKASRRAAADCDTYAPARRRVRAALRATLTALGEQRPRSLIKATGPSLQLEAHDAAATGSKSYFIFIVVSTMLCRTRGTPVTSCVLNVTFGCNSYTSKNGCLTPKTVLWTRGKCGGTFDVGNRYIKCAANSNCSIDDPIKNMLPDTPMPKDGTCLVLFSCSRVAYPNDRRFKHLNDVYRDRIPRWLTFGIETFSVDSCANNSVDHNGFAFPGITNFNFNGSMGHCVWGCPTIREKASLRFIDRHLPSRCKFVFKITGKYFAPSFGKEFERIPADADAAVQYGTYTYGKSKSSGPRSQNSEIYGIRRELIPELLNERTGDAEFQLRTFTTRRCARLHRMNRMQLSNFTMRSDWRTLTSLR